MSQPGIGAAQQALNAKQAAAWFTTPEREDRIEQYRSTTRWPVVCICGSMKFFDWMVKVAHKETLRGSIVLMPYVLKDADLTAAEKREQQKIEQALPDGINLSVFLDAMHREKIDRSDEIIVCSNGIGYIGESTNAEIQYAATKLKPIRFALDPSGPKKGDSGDDWK